MINLLTEIKNEKQQFLDEPIYVYPKLVSNLENAISHIFGSKSTPPPLIVGHNRVRLRWMKPDGCGGLVPR